MSGHVWDISKTTDSPTNNLNCCCPEQRPGKLKMSEQGGFYPVAHNCNMHSKEDAIHPFHRAFYHLMKDWGEMYFTSEVLYIIGTCTEFLPFEQQAALSTECKQAPKQTSRQWQWKAAFLLISPSHLGNYKSDILISKGCVRWSQSWWQGGPERCCLIPDVLDQQLILPWIWAVLCRCYIWVIKINPISKPATMAFNLPTEG